MKVKLVLFVTGFCLIVLSAGIFNPSVSPQQKKPETHELIIEKIKIEKEYVWKVAYKEDSTRTKVVVHKNDRITWTVKNSNAYFQFPKKILRAVGPPDSLKKGYTKFLMKGKPLRLTVSAKADTGTYVYAVFITADSVFAEGDTPPKIIIR
jgi:hypothetical protein